MLYNNTLNGKWTLESIIIHNAYKHPRDSIVCRVEIEQVTVAEINLKFFGVVVFILS